MKPARIVFVDQTAELGGAELCLLDQLRARSGAAQDRVVLFKDGPLAKLLRDAQIEVHVEILSQQAAELRRESGVFRQVVAMHGMRRQIHMLRGLAEDCDVMYANTAKALVALGFALRGHSARLVYHLHDIITSSHFSRGNRWLLVHLANRYADTIICNSQATADAFVAAGGNRDLTRVIYNGFDVDALRDKSQNGGTPIEGIRSQLRIQSGQVFAVFGRLAPWKGQHVAIQALSKLINNGRKDIHLLLVGDALFGETDYAASLRELAVGLGIANFVHFLGFQHDVPTLMQTSDAIIHCSTAPEPFGRVIVEGMLANKPVIASDAGGAREIVLHEQTGLLHTMGDAQSLADAMEWVLQHPSAAAELATAGCEVAARRFRLPEIAAQIDEVLEAAAMRARRRRLAVA